MPQGVSSVHGQGRDPLPAAVNTCISVSPSPAGCEMLMSVFSAGSPTAYAPSEDATLLSDCS